MAYILILQRCLCRPGAVQVVDFRAGQGQPVLHLQTGHLAGLGQFLTWTRTTLLLPHGIIQKPTAPSPASPTPSELTQTAILSSAFQA